MKGNQVKLDGTQFTLSHIYWTKYYVSIKAQKWLECYIIAKWLQAPNEGLNLIKSNATILNKPFMSMHVEMTQETACDIWPSLLHRSDTVHQKYKDLEFLEDFLKKKKSNTTK